MNEDINENINEEINYEEHDLSKAIKDMFKNYKNYIFSKMQLR